MQYIPNLHNAVNVPWLWSVKQSWM